MINKGPRRTGVRGPLFLSGKKQNNRRWRDGMSGNKKGVLHGGQPNNTPSSP